VDYDPVMKNVWFFFIAIVAVVLTGCAITEESVEGVGDRFQEGLQGRGQIVERDPTRDDFGPMYQ